MGVTLKPIETVGLRAQVANSLREAIYSGALKPGDPIRESSVSERLNVSRGPLREAMLTLEKEGLVVIHPNRGAVVRSLTPEELVEIMTLRQHLEVWALKLARERIDAAQLAALEDTFAGMLTAAKKGNVREFTRLDMEFHRIFWEASGHKLLVQTLLRVCGPVFAFADIALSQAGFDCRKIAELHRPLLGYLSRELEANPAEATRDLFEYVYGEEWDALFRHEDVSAPSPSGSRAGRKKHAGRNR